MNIPFNMEYEFDEFLRESPIDRYSFAKGIEFFFGEASQASGIGRAKLLSQVGVYHRICGELENSLINLNTAKSLILENDNARLKFVTDLRIAQTLQFLQRFDESEKLYSILENEFRNNQELKDLLDFAYQHHGKLKLEQNRFEEALELFEKALQLRRKKSEQDLIDSTLLAIELTQRNLS